MLITTLTCRVKIASKGEHENGNTKSIPPAEAKKEEKEEKEEKDEEGLADSPDFGSLSPSFA